MEAELGEANSENLWSRSLGMSKVPGGNESHRLHRGWSNHQKDTWSFGLIGDQQSWSTATKPLIYSWDHLRWRLFSDTRCRLLASIDFKSLDGPMVFLTQIWPNSPILPLNIEPWRLRLGSSLEVRHTLSQLTLHVVLIAPWQPIEILAYNLSQKASSYRLKSFHFSSNASGFFPTTVEAKVGANMMCPNIIGLSTRLNFKGQCSTFDGT